jgi:hypothetical protein
VNLPNHGMKNYFFSDRQEDKMCLYNFSNIAADRVWLQNILLADSDSADNISDEDRHVQELLREHQQDKKIRENYHRNPNVRAETILY